ncbi:trypsin-like peptidase domain-containing protein [Actinokineospora fastidiosa]|uniref:Serine protease n=1 Tax=Actinokineospora fastidiosa TaxID=1816 RepID=A0A918LEK3_9PSEU|nr:trypsin-like peptidase domain-containing protein [Actinokineospora fastidiosa]GGS38806.1 serine protease [Actinokineospora fastidiosa]
MTFQYLTDEALREVQRAAIDLGFATDKALESLSAGISPRFVGMYLDGGTPIGTLVSFTNRMNQTRALGSGEVPLLKWLHNAITMAAEQPEQRVFQRALEIASVDGAAAHTELPSAAAGPMDVQALPGSDGALEVVVDADDTLDVGFLHRGAQVSRSVAKLVVRRHFDGVPAERGGRPDIGVGTGWVIAPGLLITNHHVIAARQVTEARAAPGDFALQGGSVEVQFDFYHADSAVHVVRSSGCVAFDEGLDYAVLRLTEGAAPRAPLCLRPTHLHKPNSTALRERVNVLQHPDGGPMRLGFRDNFVVTGDESVLTYLTDTSGGSSGSPICDDRWSVAALHRGFRTIPSGPVTVWGKAIHQENYGTPIGRVLQHLAAHHPAVHEEVVAGQKPAIPSPAAPVLVPTGSHT